MLHSFQKTKGFTLVEMILYVGISSFLLFSLALFFSILISARVKSQTINEVNHGGIQTMQIITQTIRNAKSINYPATSVSSSSLSVKTMDSSLDPTLFNLASGTIRIKEGGNSYIPLTNSKIVVSSLLFQNTSASSTDGGSIDISFTVSRNNLAGRDEYSYSKSFKGSASFH